MSYDGTTKVGDELAKLYNFSPTDSKSVAKVMKEARAALNIGNAKRLPLEDRMAIWQYHYNKVNGGNNPTKPLKTFTKATEGYFKLINFSVKLGGNRTVINLEQYIVDALKKRFALADNSAVRQWIESAMMDNFDANAPIMRQVRFAIFNELTNA